MIHYYYYYYYYSDVIGMVDWALKINDLFAGVPQLQEKQACFPASSSVTQPWSETSAASWPICEYNYELQHWTQTPSTGLWHTMILPSTTTIFSYVIGSWKLSANEQFFIGAQTVVSLLQTIQIKQGWSNKVYTCTNKTTIVWIEVEFFFFTRGCCVSCLRWCLGARLLPQSY